jgi:hypothetical protein
MTRSHSFLRSALLVALLGLGSAGCSALDLVDPPTFELNDNDRACIVDDDCAGVAIVSERGTLLADSDPDQTGPMPACLEASVGCNANRGVCEAEVRVRSGDGDEFYDPACQGYPFPPFVEDCDDSKPTFGSRDSDGDGQVSVLCTREPGNDCDDTRGSVRSGAAAEYCDGFISDCDGWVDGVSPARPEEDRDGDLVAALDADCVVGTPGEAGLTLVFTKDDCDDTNPFVFANAPEVCDGVINDCEVGSGPRAGEDGDGDGFGLPDADCEDSDAFPKTDCDDTNAATYPGAPEVCDRITNDCDMPQVVQLAEDRDGDGFASYDAPCAPGPIPYGECIDGGDNDPTSRFCPFLEEVPAIEDSLASANGVAFADFNGDGRGDILAGSASPGLVRLYTQLADGGFTSPATLSVNAAVRVLRTGPLFDDPNPLAGDDAVDDLVVVNGSSGQVTAVCNDGSGPAAPSVVLPTVVMGARDAVVVRVGPNTPAVAYISPLQGNLYLAETIGPSSPRCDTLAFDPTTLTIGAVSPTAITGGRFLTRGTAVEDIVVVTTTGDAFLFANAPAQMGGFQLVAAPIATGLAGALSATAGDFNGDGRLDVVVGTSTGAYFLENTDGTATGFVASAIAGSPSDVVSTSASDINLDGRDDLITASSSADSVDWWERVGTGWLRHSLVSDFNGASAAVAGDVDSDGDLDVIGTAFQAATVTWWTTEIVSNATFVRANVDRAFDGATVSLAADMNQDSRPDIVGLGAELLSWWTVEGTATAPVYTESEIAPLEDGAALASGDFNADGALDLVVSDDDGLRVMLNGTNGSAWMTLSTANGLGAPGAGLLELAVGDVTGDGRPDIVGVTGATVQYWENSGGAVPSFTNTSVAALANTTSVALGDVNGDGRLDIVVSNSGAVGLQVFTRATPSAAFAATVIPDAPSALHVVVGDLDGDGTDEIFSGDRTLMAALVAYWTWTGSAFERHIISTASLSTWTHRLELADMDADGDLDLVVAFGATIAVRWFENVNGTDAGWVSHLVTGVGARAEGLAAADYDQDGDTDLVVAHEEDSVVILYKNDGVAWWRPSGR